MSGCDKPLCLYRAAQLNRAYAEMLELRLQVADGPRARVVELEGQLERANRAIAERNTEIEKLRKSTRDRTVP